MQTQTSKNANAAQTFTGCLMKETDYRHAHNLGNGAIGGVGLGDEFVLTDVKVSPPKNSASSANSSKTSDSSKSSDTSMSSQTAASSTCADQGTAYRLTGTAEEKIKGLVGHQLEVQGRLKKADTASASGTETRPNEPGQKEKLPAEVEIISFRETSNRDAVSEPSTPIAQDQPQTTQPQTQSQQTQPQTTQPQQTQPQNPPATSPVPTREPSGADQTTAQPEKHQLPKTASMAPLLALIGVLALAVGLALTLIRRRRPL